MVSNVMLIPLPLRTASQQIFYLRLQFGDAAQQLKSPAVVAEEISTI